MDTTALFRMIRTNANESIIIHNFIQRNGFESLIDYLDKGFQIPGLGSRTKNSLFLVDHVINNKANAIECLAKLTEIPITTINKAFRNNVDINIILDHPEKLEIDSRQSYAFRCLNTIYHSYIEDNNNRENQLQHEGDEYELYQ